MSTLHRRPPSLEFHVFRGSDVVSQRLLTADQLRSRSWQHVRYDVYGDARLECDHGLACRAAITGLPPRATIAGPSAAYLWGVDHAAGPDDDVHLIAPFDARISPRRGVRVHAVRLHSGERVDGALPRTTPLRTAWDVAGWLAPLAAVPIIDGLLAAQLVSAVELADMVVARAGKRGSRRAATAFGLADARAQSAPESRLRVRFVLAGLPRPAVQLAVVVGGGIVLHPDLAWEEFRVAVEYDGVWHATADQMRRDRRRLNLLVADGWLVLHVTSDRLGRDFGGVVREVKAALASRGWRG
ncbi:MAG TPA: DUF559 domain-containing protein [Micromonosporaceae bacterium]|jgi:very-short-patch-repair endonuclease